jgi:hypothetical protein
MLWFFSRENESLRVETRYDNETAEYLLVVNRPDGLPETERFRDAAVFRQRLIQVEKGLSRDRWVTSKAPVLLPHGWPKKAVP